MTFRIETEDGKVFCLMQILLWSGIQWFHVRGKFCKISVHEDILLVENHDKKLALCESGPKKSNSRSFPQITQTPLR